MVRIHQFIVPTHSSKGEAVQIADRYIPKLLVLSRGRAKVSRTDTSGNEQVIRILRPGDYIGETAVFSDTAVQYDTIALEDSSFCTLDKNHLRQMLTTQPDLALKILGDMAKRLQSVEAQLESLGQKPAEQRLLDALRHYASGQTAFTLGISKKDLASQIGVRPETLSRLFKRLKNNQHIRQERKTITFLAKP